MVELSLIKPGDKLWYSNLEISYSKGHFNKKIEPIEVEVSIVDPSKIYGSKVYVTWTDKKGKKHDEWTHEAHLYLKIEDAVEVWNRLILNAIDWVEAERDKKVAKLKKNLIKL